MINTFWRNNKDELFSMLGMAAILLIAGFFSEIIQGMSIALTTIAGFVILLFGFARMSNSTETYRFIDHDIGSLPREKKERLYDLFEGFVYIAIGIGMMLLYVYVLFPLVPKM